MAVDPSASLISPESLQAAELISNVAYGSTGFAADANLTQDLANLAAAGWTEMAPPTDTGNNYAGVAFYKIIRVNGVNTVQVIIGNRGTDSLSDIFIRDFEIALGGQPASDTQALEYYQQVIGLAKNIAKSNGGIAVSVLETGHSLGGQEADFVATSPSTQSVPTAAITFDAPGQSNIDASAAVFQDAFNIYNQGDLVHLAGGPYVGGSAEINAEVVSLVSAFDRGAIVGAGFAELGMLVGGVAGVGEAGLYANHSLAAINAFLAAHPALGDINFDLYSPDQLTQQIVNALVAITPSDFYAMSAAQKASFYANIFNTTSISASLATSSGSGATSGAIETFTATASSSNSQTLTGSMGDTISQTVSGATATSSTNDGYSITQTYDTTTGALSSDTWKNAIGTKGSDTYATDGSSTATVTYADGNYAKTINDGQGNITTDYYSKDGVEIRATWVHSDGSSGSEELYADGQTVTPNSSSADSVPTTESSVLRNPDGSYSTYSSNPLSRVGVIRPPGVGIYRPVEPVPRGVSNDPVEGPYFAGFWGLFEGVVFEAGGTFGSRYERPVSSRQ